MKEMKDRLDECKLLASLVVFKELYDRNKDVFKVLSEFIDEIIVSKKQYKFDLTEITNLLNETYCFTIPEAVVRTSIKRLKYVNRKKRDYYVIDMPKESKYNLNFNQEEIHTIDNIIIEPLFSYIEIKKNIELSEVEKEKILQSFSSFLMDDSLGEYYSEYISGFIIEKCQDKEFRNKLKMIREGVILYLGFQYNKNISDLGSWRTELTIYLDTEILFHFAGYNGIVYKSLFDDFYRYVKEINNKSKIKPIKLKYFREVKVEIENFFAKARDIIEGKSIVIPNKTAMISLINGCNVPSDLVEKKTDFYISLKNKGIFEEELFNYYEKSEHKHNIDDQNIIDTISSDFGYDISEHLRFLNFVSIRRKDSKSNDFANIRYIFLTGNSTTRKVAWHRQIKTNREVPLATDLYWITSKFWFKLNKGFGEGDLPKTFDVITKAQLLLSADLNESIDGKFKELNNRFKEGKISKEQVNEQILILRSQARKPEEIAHTDISSILNSLTEESIEKSIKERERVKEEVAKQVEENIELRKAIKGQKEITLEEKKKRVSLLKNQKMSIKKKVNRKFRSFKLRLGFLFFLVIFIIIFLILRFGWNSIEPWLFFIPLIGSVLFLLIKNREFSFKQILVRKKEKFRLQKYEQEKFDESLINDLENEVTHLEEEIENLKSQ